MMTNLTYQFKEIAPNYDEFKSNMVKFMPILADEMVSIDENLIFPAIYAMWASIDILYDRIDTFYRRFALDYYNRRNAFVRKMAILTDINSTETMDIIESYRQFNVASFNNATILDAPLSEINPYVDAQQVEGRRINTLDANLRLLDNIKEQYLYDFVLDFATHFANISTNYEYFYFWR